MESIRDIVGFAGLGCLSVADVRRRELATLPILAVGGAGILLSLFGGLWAGPEALCQFLPGAACLLIAYVSRESIGYGDGLVVLCLGGYLSFSQLMGLCLTALTLAGIAALFLLAVMKKGRKATLPFVPFLLAGYVIVRACGIR